MLVVMGHVIQYILTSESYTTNSIWQFIYSFHMPLFMVLSGYITGILNNKNACFFSIIRRRAEQLLVPFFSWALLTAFFLNDMQSFFKTIVNPTNGLWFLWVLFFVVCINSIFTKFMQQYNLHLAVGGVIIVLFYIIMQVFLLKVGNIFAMSLIADHVIYYTTGTFIGKYNVIESLAKKRYIVKYLILLSILLISVFLSITFDWNQHTFNTGLPIYINKLLYKSYRISVGLICSIGVIMMFNSIKKYLQKEVVIGKVTLGIYAIHFIYIKLLSSINYINNITGFYFLDLFILTGVTLLFSTITTLLISKNKLLSLILVGKNK